MDYLPYPNLRRKDEGQFYAVAVQIKLLLDMPEKVQHFVISGISTDYNCSSQGIDSLCIITE